MLKKMFCVVNHADLFKTSIRANAIVVGIIVSILSAVSGFSQNDAIKKTFLDDRSQKIPQKLFSVLEDWKAVPNWVIERRNLREDWLETLHEKRSP